jgi:hypothetical protein
MHRGYFQLWISPSESHPLGGFPVCPADSHPSGGFLVSDHKLHKITARHSNLMTPKVDDAKLIELPTDR